MALWKAVLRQQQQFLEAFKEFVAATGILPHSQRIGRDRVGPRCATKSEIERIVQGNGPRRGRGHGRQIEDGKRDQQGFFAYRFRARSTTIVWWL